MTQQNQPTSREHDAQSASGGTLKTVFGTLAIIILLIVIVMGGLFVYKRFYTKPDFSIRMHFENPRNTLEAARVKISKGNVFMTNRQNNNNNRTSKEPIPSTMVEEQEITELTAIDDTRNLLL